MRLYVVKKASAEFYFMTSSYIGRFAPSPSGPLHMGSLICALASYLDAKANHGQWLVRIDDIDPPREQEGATQLILQTLTCHGLHWDGDVFYQSKQGDRYRKILQDINRHGLSYRCNCSRKRLKQLSGKYDRYCVDHPPPSDEPASIRLNLESCAKLRPAIEQNIRINDQIQGLISEDIRRGDDFIIHRKDGLFAYQLAVVADDMYQGITHIIRGTDLLDTTTRQAFLTQILNGTPALYGHIPVLVNHDGKKLSKQNHAPAIDHLTPIDNLKHACTALNLSVPRSVKAISELLRWAIEAWHLDRLSKVQTIPINSLYSV